MTDEASKPSDVGEEAAEAIVETAESAAAEGSEQALQDEIAALRDQLLREQAEAQNVRRRAEREVEQARKFALERFAADLLPVIDNLDRALASLAEPDEALKPVLEGVELTQRQLGDVLRRFQIEEVNPKDQVFDPQLHEAVASVPVPGVAPNTVIDVMQKGYTLNGRVLRAAMVVVAKAES